MEGDYFEPEDPPSCVRTCLVMCATSIVITVIFIIIIAFRDEPNFYLITIIGAIVTTIVIMPPAWWAGKRVKKWVRFRVEQERKEKQFEDDGL
jgi:hypothetical protein